MSKKIKVFIKRPGEKPYSTYISNSLKNLQNTVGGYIETVTLCTDFAVICNEKGRLKGPPYNCTVMNVSFCGTVIFVGVDGEEFADVPISFDQFRALFSSLFDTVGGAEDE